MLKEQRGKLKLQQREWEPEIVTFVVSKRPLVKAILEKTERGESSYSADLKVNNENDT